MLDLLMSAPEVGFFTGNLADWYAAVDPVEGRHESSDFRADRSSSPVARRASASRAPKASPAKAPRSRSPVETRNGSPPRWNFDAPGRCQG